MNKKFVLHDLIYLYYNVPKEKMEGHERHIIDTM